MLITPSSDDFKLLLLSNQNSTERSSVTTFIKFAYPPPEKLYAAFLRYKTWLGCRCRFSVWPKDKRFKEKYAQRISVFPDFCILKKECHWLEKAIILTIHLQDRSDFKGPLFITPAVSYPGWSVELWRFWISPHWPLSILVQPGLFKKKKIRTHIMQN